MNPMYRFSHQFKFGSYKQAMKLNFSRREFSEVGFLPSGRVEVVAPSYSDVLVCQSQEKYCETSFLR